MTTTRLDTATILERTFSLYRQQAAVLLPAALVLMLPLIVLFAASVAVPLLLLPAVLISFLVSSLYTGVVVLAAADLQDGQRDLSVRELVAAARPFMGPLLLAGLFYAFGVLVGMIFLIIPGLILATLWSLAPPVIVVEHARPIAAFKRSREIVRGTGWRVFGVLLVIAIVSAVAGQLLTVLGTAAGGAVAGQIAGGIGSALTLPLGGLAICSIYFALAPSAGAAAPAPFASPVSASPLPGGWLPPQAAGTPLPPAQPPATDPDQPFSGR